MKLLVNENFPRQAVEALQADGHDLLWARTVMQGASDIEILDRAQVDSRILITFDKDFGELAFRWGLPAQCGVILFRIPMSDPQTVAQLVRSLLSSRSDWMGHFSVVDESRIRMRALK